MIAPLAMPLTDASKLPSTKWPLASLHILGTTLRPTKHATDAALKHYITLYSELTNARCSS